MRAVDVIIKKKNKQKLSKEEIHFIIDGYVKGTIPDFQVSSLLMAIVLNGLDKEEQAHLTMEMLESGEKIDLSSIDGICVDKHSTGGVGDKTTLVIAPIVASCGLKIAKMSGRGLGHTGGTLDKLESIPGFQINVTSEHFLKQVNEISIAVIGQTANITPADKKLYALRDVTGTVESTGLIASSIMSKKLASGANSILLDVKVGDGAFMKTLDDARTLARAMVDIGNSLNRKTVAVLTNMDEPLGEMVGNSLEVIEAIETLKGRGPKVLKDLCVDLSAELLLMTNKASNKEEAIKKVEESINNGSALEKFKEMIKYQGGNPLVVDNYDLFPQAKNKIEVKAVKSGYIHKLEALEIGNAAMILGAGRENKDDVIDLGVGIQIHKRVGDYVLEDETLAVIYGNGKNESEASKMILEAYNINKDKTNKNKMILDLVR